MSNVVFGTQHHLQEYGATRDGIIPVVDRGRYGQTSRLGSSLVLTNKRGLVKLTDPS